MRYALDTEFTEDGPDQPVDLISLGLVCEDGRVLHRVNDGFSRARAHNHPFVSEHVLPDIHKIDQSLWVPREQIKADLLAFFGADRDAQVWAWYGSYDHLMQAQTYGRMVDMPEHLPWFIRDLKQEVERIQARAREIGALPSNGVLELPEQFDDEHDALADAQHVLVRHRWLSDWARRHGIDPPQ